MARTRRKYPKWYKKFVDYILPFGQVGMFIATLILLILTAIYLDFTRDMAKIMKEEFEIKFKPILEIVPHGFIVNWSLLRLDTEIEILNKGSYAIYLADYNLKYWHQDFENQKTSLPKIEINKYIFPDAGLSIDDNHILFKLRQLPITGEEEKLVIVEITFNFLDAKGNKFTEKLTRNFATEPFD